MGFFCNPNRCCTGQSRQCSCGTAVSGATTAGTTTQCVTVPQQCVTVPSQSVTLPAQNVTLPAQQVCLPPQNICFTQPAPPVVEATPPPQPQCTCTCTCTVPVQTQVSPTPPPRPRTVRALINEVLDSCGDTGDISREITVNCPAIFDPCDLEPGSSLKVRLDDDITFKEVQRDKDDCVCLSSVRFTIPLRIYGEDEACCSRYIVRNITVIRSVKLCCTNDTILTTNNTKVLAASAVVTDVCGSEIKIMISLLFRSCIQQTLLREYEWLATPVCVSTSCVDTRGSFTDPCDVVCGCVEGRTCPTC